MAFRQQIGPTASTKQLQHLLALLQSEGHADFRSARGPLGLTQRQGLGKFTYAEADVLIARLEEAAVDADGHAPAAPTAPPTIGERPLQDSSTDELLAELRHRGWEPPEPS